MTAARRHSLVIATMLELFRLLGSTPWPTTDEEPHPPEVLLGLLGKNPQREAIQLVGRTQDDSQQFVTFGQASKEETFTLRVDIWSTVPGREPIDVLERFDVLVAELDGQLRSMTTGNPIIPASVAKWLKWWEINQVIPDVFAGVEGAQGIATVLIRCTARI